MFIDVLLGIGEGVGRENTYNLQFQVRSIKYGARIVLENAPLETIARHITTAVEAARIESPTYRIFWKASSPRKDIDATLLRLLYSGIAYRKIYGNPRQDQELLH